MANAALVAKGSNLFSHARPNSTEHPYTLLLPRRPYTPLHPQLRNRALQNGEETERRAHPSIPTVAPASTPPPHPFPPTAPEPGTASRREESGRRAHPQLRNRALPARVLTYLEATLDQQTLAPIIQHVLAMADPTIF